MFCLVKLVGHRADLEQGDEVADAQAAQASISRSATVSGLPAMTKPLSTSDFQSSRQRRRRSRPAVGLEANSVLRFVR